MITLRQAKFMSRITCNCNRQATRHSCAPHPSLPPSLPPPPQLASDVLTQHSPYLTQEPVKRLRMSSTYQPLAVGCDARGVHLLLHARSIVRYVLYNLHTGKFGQHAPFGEVVSRYLVRQGCPLQLLPISMSLWLLVDGHGGLYPLCKDSMGSMKDPPLLVGPPSPTP